MIWDGISVSSARSEVGRSGLKEGQFGLSVGGRGDEVVAAGVPLGFGPFLGSMVVEC